MDRDFFNILCIQYAPIIETIINTNAKFYGLQEQIRWQFYFDERVANFAFCDRTTNILAINIGSIHFSFLRNEPLQIEYFLMHEIRHVYQHIEINNYKNNPDKCTNPYYAKIWTEEVEHYNNPTSNSASYFQQNMEFDAFVFAYSILKYKYKILPDYLTRPTAYGQEFDDAVNNWCETFKNENL